MIQMNICEYFPLNFEENEFISALRADRPLIIPWFGWPTANKPDTGMGADSGEGADSREGTP